MLATDPAPVARPSEGHRVAASKRTRAGRDGAEKSEGHRKGGVDPAAFTASLRDADQPGHEALAEFYRAPAATKQAFWAEVRKRTEAARLESAKLEDEAAEAGFSLPDFFASVLLLRIEDRWRPGARRIWNQRWRDRAYRDRMYEDRGRLVDDGFDAAKARLLEIPADEYVDRLLGPEVHRRGRMISCPFHDERTPSCSLRDGWFHCHGCGVGGSIYDFAGMLWDLDRRGHQFMEIHKRLIEVFG